MGQELGWEAQGQTVWDRQQVLLQQEASSFLNLPGFFIKWSCGGTEPNQAEGERGVTPAQGSLGPATGFWSAL